MIDLIKDYILSNFYWILPIFISILECFIIVLFKKKPVFNLYDEIWLSVFVYLPQWIKEAEELYQDGMSKLTYVLNKAVSFAPELFHEKSHFITLRKQIEEILSCPQKKGGE